MSKLADINNYHDLSGLQNLKAKATSDPGNKEALKKAAEHFESIFIGMMLKSMREANAAFEDGNPMHSNTTKFFRDMYDQQLATDMASNGSMGLADIIVKQLSGDTENFKSASVLRNNSDLTRQNYATNELKPIGLTNQAVPEPIQTPNLKSENPALSMMAQMSNPTSLLSSFNQVIDKSFAQIGAEKPTASVTSKPEKQNVKFESPDDFISTVWQFAKKAASKLGVNPAVIVAQSALETGWGKHIIQDKNGESSFNLFNVKAHRDWEGDKAAKSTLEYEKGVAVRKVEPFRVYDNFSEAFDDFVGFLKSNSRYQPALEKAADSEQFLQNLQKAGYATDPNYADKILGILNSDKFKNVIGKVSQTVNNKVGA